MKRILPLALVAMTILLCGCETTRDQIAKEAENAPKTERITATALPYPDLHYNDKTLKIKDITLYQSYSDEKFIYHPYCVVRLDASGLSKEDIHYLGNGDLSQSRYAYLDVDCEYDSPSNEIKDDKMDFITKYTDGTDLVYAYYDYSQSFAQHSLEDMVVDLDIEIIQSDGKIVKMTDTAYKNYYDIEINGDSDIKIEVKDDSELPESENSMLEKGFGEIIDRGF